MLNLSTYKPILHYKKIKIAGAGIAGMTAAINLKQTGHDVVMYEKKSKVGESRHGDYEGLENWIFKDSLPAFFNLHGIDFKKFSTIPIHKFIVHTEKNDPFVVQAKQPFFHLIKRGSDMDCLDQQLYEQCKNAGVDFEFSRPASAGIDIDSTGSKRAAAYIKGVNFETTLTNQVHLLLGQKYAPKGYAYLIILNGRATLASAFKKTKNTAEDPLQNAIAYFRNKGFIIPERNIFGSRGSFSILNMKIMQKPFHIGEAGGFQDYLFGFGIRIAMNSGLVAALLLNGELKTAKHILRKLNRKRNLSYINRVIYERLNDQQMAKLAVSFAQVDDPIDILSRAYKWNFKNMMRWIGMKQQYEIRPA